MADTDLLEGDDEELEMAFRDRVTEKAKHLQSKYSIFELQQINVVDVI